MVRTAGFAIVDVWRYELMISMSPSFGRRRGHAQNLLIALEISDEMGIRWTHPVMYQMGSIGRRPIADIAREHVDGTDVAFFSRERP